MRFPNREEIAHDQNHVPPALDILGASFILQIKLLLIKRILFLGLTLLVVGLDRQELNDLFQEVLVVADSRDVDIADVQSLQNFGSQHFQFGFQDSALGMQKVFQGAWRRRVTGRYVFL